MLLISLTVFLFPTILDSSLQTNIAKYHLLNYFCRINEYFFR